MGKGGKKQQQKRPQKHHRSAFSGGDDDALPSSAYNTPPPPADQVDSDAAATASDGDDGGGVAEELPNPQTSKFDLYQRSVQRPRGDISYLQKFFLMYVGGRMPLHLQEDFCGTALLWCQSC